MKSAKDTAELLKKLVKYVKPKLVAFAVAVNYETFESLVILDGELCELKRKTNDKNTTLIEATLEKVKAREITNAIKKYGITSKKLRDLFKTADEVKRLADKIEKDPKVQKELKKPDG